jgi:hypothetical protein
MRFMIASLAVLGIAVGMSALPAPGWTTLGGDSVLVAAQQQPAPQGKVDIDIDVNRRGGGDWWANPMWIAIGVIGIVLLVVIVAMVARGGGTTVIKE